jgi:hypothetical protein
LNACGIVVYLLTVADAGQECLDLGGALDGGAS